MSECDDSVDKPTLPNERAQPHQPIQIGNDQEQAAYSGPLLDSIIGAGTMNRQGDGARKHIPVLDQARFAAGIVGLYETILSEPIPEKMLRLIEEIGKRERKS